MTVPFLTATAAILYIARLWHDRSAADRSRDNSEKPLATEPNRTREIYNHARVVEPGAKALKLKNTSIAIAKGAAQ